MTKSKLTKKTLPFLAMWTYPQELSGVSKDKTNSPPKAKNKAKAHRTGEEKTRRILSAEGLDDALDFLAVLR